MNPPELHADGLLLRAWQPGDADAVYRACQDSDIQRWTAVPRPYLHEHAISYVTEISPNGWADGSTALFAVCDATTGEMLASCGLVVINERTGTGELGYWTAPWARGRGVMVAASRAVARWAFESRGLNRLIWHAEIGNHASRLVALRTGFTIGGQIRLADLGGRGNPLGWVGTLLPGEVPVPDEAGPAGPDSLQARRAHVFGRPQPELFATTEQHGELRLRPMEEQDLDAIVVTCRDPDTIRWTTVPDPYPRSDAEGFLAYVRQGWALGTMANYVITDGDDEFAGTIDLRISTADPLVADVGFMTAPRARGRGYLSAALTAVAAWGFTSLGLARIEWRANVGNTASRRVAEKAGFTFEGTTRGLLTHRGTRVDSWVAALLPEDLR